MQAIVLVGGQGTRLRPLTDTVPKPALTLVDRPFLAYMVEWLGSHGVSEVVLACGFLPDQLREALGEREHDGVALTYVVEPDRRGTAGAIRFAADALGGRLDDRFLALNGDVLTDLDLTALLRFHEESGARATLGLYEVEDSSAYGLVECGPGGAVVDFTEKTGEAVPGAINAGTYVLERSVLDLIPADRELSIEREVFPRLVGDGLHALPLAGYWMDIGIPERYLQATWDILEGRVETAVRATAPDVYLGTGCEVSESARIGPRAVVSAGCAVEAGAAVTDSVLLGDCTVGAGARVSGSILGAGTAVGSGSRLDGAVVAANGRAPGR
ncbi:MAG TPA: NDP-sugar synthase [Solirubrobacterales bacterium]|nr:NDP-sugar synthase [Solirubrobacterales bacterium]